MFGPAGLHCLLMEKKKSVEGRDEEKVVEHR